MIKSFLNIGDVECDVFILSVKFNLESGFHKINSFPILFQPLLLIILSCMSSVFVSALNFLYLKRHNNSTDRVFYSACDYNNRFFYLERCLHINSFSVVYLPPISLKLWMKHWKSRKWNVYFNSFSFGDLANFLFQCFSSIRVLHSLNKSLDTFNKLESRHIFKVLLQFKLYDIHVNNTDSIRNYQIGISKKYIFDYERGNLFPLLIKLNKSGAKTIHFQHGLMQKPNNFYLPALAKFVFCCSMREKHLYIDSGFPEKSVFVLGSPIQTFHFDDGMNVLQPLVKYDLLIILGSTEVSIYESFQRDCLKMIGDSFKGLTVLCRFRPASRSLDRLKLARDLQSFVVSENSSLDFDIMSSKVVVSFSFDAAFVSFRYERPTCLAAPLTEVDIRLKDVCVDSPLKLISGIKNMLHKENNKQYLENIKLLLGEYDFNVYKTRLVNAILYV